MSGNSIILALAASALLAVSNSAESAFNLTAPTAAKYCAECDKPVLKEGALSDKYRLGVPVEFDDGVGINDGKCFPLYSGGRFLTWLHNYHITGNRIYVLRCVENPSITDIAPNSVGGVVEDVYGEIQWPNEQAGARFIKLDLPLWSEFSNPAFCDTYVAYWGAEFDDTGRVRVHAVVINLISTEVVKKEFLGVLRIESDSRSFFSAPKWASDGQSVLFDNAAGRETSTKSRVEPRKITLPAR